MSAVFKLAISAPPLNQFNFVTFGRVDECDGAAVAKRMGAIRQRVTFGRSLFCEFCQIIHLKREMGQIRPDYDRAALVVLADLDLFFASRSLEENQLRAASGGVPSCFLQPKNVSIEGDRLFQVGHAITGVQQFLDHHKTNLRGLASNSNSTMLCLGLDSGRTTCKRLVLDDDTGRVLDQARVTHSFVGGLPHGHVEQDPQIWSDAAERVILTCLEKIGERRSEVVAFGVSAQQHGLVPLDDRNQPGPPAKLWCDPSTAEKAEKLNRALGNTDTLIERTGNAMVPGYTAPKILWLKENEPENFAATRTILLPHDFLNFWLTGERRMEYGDASGTGLLDIRSRTWCEPLAEFIDKGLLTKFSPLRSSTRAVGLLRSTLREKFQLGDILVMAGGGDNMLGAIGTGNISPGRLTISLGTSGTIYTFVETPVFDPRGEISAFCDSTDHWLALACTMNVANAVGPGADPFVWGIPRLQKKVRC